MHVSRVARLADGPPKYYEAMQDVLEYFSVLKRINYYSKRLQMMFIVDPYIGVRQIRFGMTKIANQQAIESIDQVSDVLDEIVWIHSASNFLLVQISKDKLIEVDFGRRVTKFSARQNNFFYPTKSHDDYVFTAGRFGCFF